MAQHTRHNAPQNCCSSDMLLFQVPYYIIILFFIKQKTKMGIKKEKKKNQVQKLHQHILHQNMICQSDAHGTV